MYTLTNSNVIIRDSDASFIPVDESNMDYQEYLSWVNEGNSPNPVPPKTQEEIREEIKAQIEKIERDDLMNRRAREAFILQAEQIAADQYGLTPEQLYAVNPGYKGAKDVDNEVKALRALL